jgi:citrate lyase beta subunit
MSNIKAVVTFQNQDDLLVLETFALSTSAEMSLSAPEIVADSRTSLYRIILSVTDYATANTFLNTLWAQAKTQNIEFVKCDLVDLDTFDAGVAASYTTN